MSITIKKIYEQKKDNVKALVEHNDNPITTYINGTKQQLEHLLNTLQSIEIDYEQVTNIELQKESDNATGLYPADYEGNIMIIGKVSNIIRENNTCLYDIFITDGCEIITLSKKEINDLTLEIGQYIKATLHNTVFYLLN